jgi:uncharacterized protein (TIGR00730 family)
VSEPLDDRRPATGSTPPSPRPRRTSDLIDHLRDSADKLENDQTSRGDLKILSRAVRELRYAFKVFAPYRSKRKVTIFGSARTPPDQPVYAQAVAFGRAMADRDWLVVTGAASGIMEAGHVGAGRDRSMGLNILLPFEQTANSVIAGDHKLVHMKYFFTRKLMFVKECHAVVLFPGGFGTLDEGLEVLTLLQTGKRDMVPIVFVDAPGGTFWHAWHKFVLEHLAGGGMISPDDLALYRLTDNWQAAVDEIMQFYRVYHSMRYVKEQLVLRINQPLAPGQLDEINTRFSDIVSKGHIVQRAALKDEKDEPELADLTRLVFHFNRHCLGRLRQLIDQLNATSC